MESKDKKILFSHSYYYQLDQKQWETGMPYPPLGTIQAAAYLRENSYQVSLFDVGLKEGPEEIKDILKESDSNVLVIYDDGFNYLTKMCLTNMREAAFKMISYAKAKNCKVIVSSSDSTDHFELYHSKGADVVLLGEGEETLLDVVNAYSNNKPVDDIKGITYLRDKQVVNNGRRSVLRELDKLPIPAWDLVNVDAYKQIWRSKGNSFRLNIATTRGCPYKCNWCAKPIYGNRYNSRSPEHVVKEIKLIKEKFGVTSFWMCDDIFGLKPGWVQAFRDLLKENNLKIAYKIQSRADLLLKEDNLQALVDSGLEEVWIGAESGSQKILDAMDKGITLEQIKESTQLLQEKGVRVAYFLQFGYLGETKQDVEATIKMLHTNQPDDIGVSVSYPLPGTPFYDKVQEQLKAKANWTDSDELALMFKNTFNSDFYKTLHRYVHKVFRNNQAKKYHKEKGIFNMEGAKQLLKRFYYTPLIILYRSRLNKLENK